MDYEYCVMHHRYPDEPHRGPMSLVECLDWISGANRDGIKTGTFYVARREISRWSRFQMY
jgi:hypothetical protein